MKVFYSFYTNVGKMRANNEDALLLMDELFCEENLEECSEGFSENDYFLFVVADGMGGHKKGEVASRLVLESLLEEKEKIYEDLEEGLQRAKKRLNEYAKKNPLALGLGCAVAGLVIKDNFAKVFNVGDCRVYRFVNNKLIKLSKDHSVVERLLSEGLITEEQARDYPQKNVLTSAIMGDLSENIPEIFVREMELYDGDFFLLCSDGLWEELEKHELIDCFSEEKPCRAILDLLKEKPLKDNVSFILVKIKIEE